jgi:hypothetical protein
MYRFAHSSHPSSNPLQGMLGLGAVVSFFRNPIYSCADEKTRKDAKSRCDSRRPGTVVNYDHGYHTIRKGTKENPYQLTIADLYRAEFDSCKIARVKDCPIQLGPDEDLTQIPIPEDYPVKTPPSEPYKSYPKPPPPPDSGITQIPIPEDYPVKTTPVPTKAPLQESTPVQISIPTPQNLPTHSMVSEVTPVQIVRTEDPVSILPVEEEIVIEEPQESDYSKQLWVGGVLLLVAGGGLAYYLTRKKKRK